MMEADRTVKAYEKIRDDLKKQRKAFDEVKAGHKECKMMEADRIVKAYVKIRDDLKAKQKAFDEVKAGHKQKMALLEAELKKLCDKVGVKSLPTVYGTASLSTKDFVKVNDWPRALEYIKSNDLWQLLTKKVSKTEVKDFMEAHDNTVPPGLEYGATQEISVRRPAKRKV